MKPLTVEFDRIFAMHLEAAMREAAAVVRARMSAMDDKRAGALILGADAIRSAIIEAARGPVPRRR